MKRFAYSLALLSCSLLHAQQTQGLTLQRTITLPGVTGKFDHFAFDRAGNRLFVSAAGPHAVEVIDLATGNISESLEGVMKPHGMVWIAATQKLYVADGAKGQLDVFAGSPLKQIGTVALSEDADDMAYDEATKLLYVGHGGTNASNPASVAIIATDTLKLWADLSVPSHPEALELDVVHDRILVNIADSGLVAVIDGKTQKIIARWPLGQSKGNTPLAYDATQGLLLVGCRTPARMLVLDGTTGQELAKESSDAGADELFFDATNRRAYVIAGSGAIDTFSVGMHGELTPISVTRTIAGAKTGYLDEQGHHLYVGIPGVGGAAAIRVYQTQ